jgi:hypothetical protein
MAVLKFVHKIVLRFDCKLYIILELNYVVPNKIDKFRSISQAFSEQMKRET